MKPIQLFSHLAVIIILGVMAGFFWTYSINVNQAMLHVNGEIYATVQSLFNVTVRNPTFFVFFFGGGFFTFLTVLVHIPQRQAVSFWLLVTALLVYVFGIIVFTHEVSLPLNYYTESWRPTELPNDWQTTRDAWNRANWVRVATSFSAFFLALMALVVKKAT